VLHHAAQEPIFGFGIIEGLGRLGYHLGPGTKYPLLHSMERRRWLKVHVVRVERRKRKCYTATRAGKIALKEAIGRVRELFQEITEIEQ
jgi:DNA-binding PadR family transcriptional regulator